MPTDHLAAWIALGTCIASVALVVAAIIDEVREHRRSRRVHPCADCGCLHAARDLSPFAGRKLCEWCWRRAYLRECGRELRVIEGGKEVQR